MEPGLQHVRLIKAMTSRYRTTMIACRMYFSTEANDSSGAGEASTWSALQKTPLSKTASHAKQVDTQVRC